VSDLTSDGVSVTLPAGWEGRILRRGPEGEVTPAADGAATVVAHAATFPIPPEMGDFGGGAVTSMATNDVLVVLFEHGPESVGTPLFASQGIPTLRPADASPGVLRMMLEGQSGIQRFFTANDRAFCLYVVLGSHRRRIGLVGVANELLRTLRID
jgi:hypothetical protein